MFGDVANGVMRLNAAWVAAKSTWDELPAHYIEMQIDEFVVMPDHIHGIVMMNKNNSDVGAGLKLPLST